MSKDNKKRATEPPVAPTHNLGDLKGKGHPKDNPAPKPKGLGHDYPEYSTDDLDGPIATFKNLVDTLLLEAQTLQAMELLGEDTKEQAERIGAIYKRFTNSWRYLGQRSKHIIALALEGGPYDLGDILQEKYNE